MTRITKITVELDKKRSVELTEAEARELYAELHKLFYKPVAPIVIKESYPTFPPYPYIPKWGDPTYVTSDTTAPRVIARLTA